MEKQYVLRTEITGLNEKESVQQLKETLEHENMGGLIFFCSDNYDLEQLSSEINKAFDCPMMGCTTAGEIGSTYQEGGLVAASFSSDAFTFHIKTISDLENFGGLRAREIAQQLKEELNFNNSLDKDKMFGFLLIDGLSMMEELTTANLYNELGGVQIVGGSAGDSLKFKKTSVFSDKKFSTGTAAFCLIETKLDFTVFKTQHYTPSDIDMVITKADPKKRIVYEIDGGPAATELAEIVGVKKEELTMEVYSTHPVMLQIGNDWYVRSIQNYHDDDSLSFACAIDAGLPLTVGECQDLIKSLDQQTNELKEQFQDIEITLGCDCIHRRLEIVETGLKDEVESLLQPLNFLGFSTYGEQYDSVHVNQTLTGVVIGTK
jgi:hypothetical protein